MAINPSPNSIKRMKIFFRIPDIGEIKREDRRGTGCQLF
jgi:hypothetical protein